MLASRGAPSERAEKELRWHDKRHTGRNGQWIHGLWWEWGLAELFAQQIVLFRSQFCFNFYLIFYMNSKSWVFSYLFVVFLVVRKLFTQTFYRDITLIFSNSISFVLECFVKNEGFISTSSAGFPNLRSD